MAKRLSIELKKDGLRFILSNHTRKETSILDAFETGFTLGVNEDGKEFIDPQKLSNEEVVDQGIKKIQDIISNKKWGKIPAVLLYGLEDLTHQVLNIKVVDEEDLKEEIIEKLALNNTNYSFGDEIAYEIIGAPDDKGMNGIYVQVIPKSLLEKLEPLKLKGIDFEIFALNRKKGTFINMADNTMFIEIRREDTIISIYYRNYLVLTRKINLGMDNVVEEISLELGIDKEEALRLHKKYGFVDKSYASELIEKGEFLGAQRMAIAYENIFSKIERKGFQYMDYFQFKYSGETIKTAYFKGVHSRIEQINKYIKETFFLENVFYYDTLEGIRIGALDDQDQIDNDWNILLGTMDSKFGIFSLTKSFKMPFKMKKNPIYVLVTFIFIMGLVANFTYFKLQEIEQNNQLKAIESVSGLIQQELDESLELGKKIDKEESRIAYLKTITGKSTRFNRFLSDLSYVMVSQAYLEDVSYEGNKVILSGEAVSNNGYSEVIINELVREISSISKGVRLVRTSKSSATRNSFLIEVTLIGGEEFAD